MNFGSDSSLTPDSTPKYADNTTVGVPDPVASQGPRISVVIPTYRREAVLMDTIQNLLVLSPQPAEILIVDQTVKHTSQTETDLAELERAAKIRWIRLPRPSITHAMNVGLNHASGDVILFVDDDIIPGVDLISAHAHAQATNNIVAGQVLQPGEEPLNTNSGGSTFRFCSNRPQYISELMGGNFSIKRVVALNLGGFDENFVHAAYRFEAEFAARVLAAGEKILFEPKASIRHLKTTTGGTRSFGHHLTTIKPSHSVGEYYYLLRSRTVPRRILNILRRPFRAIRTRHHFSHPWWIPGTLIAETLGLIWALTLTVRGPRLIDKSELRDQMSND